MSEVVPVTSAKRKLTKEEIKGFECKHAAYVEHRGGDAKDALIIKEIIHLNDNTTVPSLRVIEDFERDYYVTKPGFQKHEFKKQFEDLDKVTRYTTTQIKMARNVAKSLNKGFIPDMRILARSQYLYGSDINSQAIVKRKYQDRFPDCHSLNSVAVADLEADVVYGHGMIASGSITYKDKVALFVTQWFLGTTPDWERQVHEKFERYLGDYKKSRNITLEVIFCTDEVDLVCKLAAKAHEWQPDFLAFWNMAYDIPKMLEVLTNAGIDPADIWSDPRVPPQYRRADWKPGATMKVTASGRKMALSAAERWNTFYIAAGFYCIDAMCLYQKIRIAGGKDPSYALDAILTKELGIRKLKFKEADHLVGIGWHVFMQKNFKMEYLIYNIFDCISIELLDEQNMDMSNKISMLSGSSDYAQFPSQPRRTCNELHFFALEHKKVIGSTSDQMGNELDKYVTSTEGWIVTLPTHMVVENGIKCIKEFPELVTKIRLHVADIDVAAAYPNTEDFLNIGAETTYRELSKIEGCSEWERRMIGINLTAGPVNAVEFCRLVYKMPNFSAMATQYAIDRNKQAVSIDRAA